MPLPTLLWLKQLGTARDDRAQAIATDSLGNVFISGYTYGNVFLAKYDAQGSQEWLKQLGTAGVDRAQAIATDSLGNVFISGYTTGELEAGQAQGSYDAFLAKYDAQGSQVWLKQLGTAREDMANAIATDSLGNIFISGYTSGELEAGQAQGFIDAFLAKYSDDLSVSHHHLLLIETKVDNLSKELAKLKHAQLPIELDLALIQAANDRTKGPGESKVSEAEAKEIVTLASGGESTITETRKKTLAYIYARYTLTRGAKEQIVKALS